MTGEPRLPSETDVQACKMPLGDGALCGAAATKAFDWVSDSSDGLVPGWRMTCAAGHWWTEYGEPVADPFGPPPAGPGVPD